MIWFVICVMNETYDAEVDAEADALDSDSADLT